MEAEKVGLASAALGAGRRRKDDAIDPAAGIVLCKKVGDPVQKGEKIATLLTSSEEKAKEGEALFCSALRFDAVKCEPRPLIAEII